MKTFLWFAPGTGMILFTIAEFLTIGRKAWNWMLVGWILCLIWWVCNATFLKDKLLK